MLSGLYAKWMWRWETALTFKDSNRIVRPLEWGFDWLSEFVPGLEGVGEDALAGSDQAANLARMIAVNEEIVARADEFLATRRLRIFGWRKGIRCFFRRMCDPRHCQRRQRFAGGRRRVRQERFSFCGLPHR
jgi:hypothetical protein